MATLGTVVRRLRPNKAIRPSLYPPSMVPLPVICDSCGTVFAATNLIGGQGAGTVQMTDVSYGPCPRCGRMGRVLDGVYELAEGALRGFVASSRADALTFMRLAALIKQAQRGEATGEQVAEAIRRDAPGAANLAERLLVPKNAGEFYALLALLLTLLTFAVSVTDDALSRDDFEHVTREAFEKVIGELPPSPTTVSPDRQRTKRPPPPPRKRHQQSKRRRDR